MRAKTGAGERLEGKRRASDLRLDDAAYLVRQALPHLRCSRETLRRYEAEETPEWKWNPEIIAALAQVYECSRSELSPIAAQRLDDLRDLLDGTLRCIAA